LELCELIFGSGDTAQGSRFFTSGSQLWAVEVNFGSFTFNFG